MADRDTGTDSTLVRAGNGLVVVVLLVLGAALLLTPTSPYLAILPLVLGVLGIPGVFYPRVSYLRIVYWFWP